MQATLSVRLARAEKSGIVSSMSGAKKAALRDEIRLRMARWSEEERRGASQKIEETILGLMEWREASVVGFYLSLTDEPQTRGLLQKAWGEGKKVYLPKIDIREGLTWWEISPCHLPETGTLWEPSPGLSVRKSLENVGLFLVPGRAFDSKGARLGRGGGHYDRALARRGRTSCVMGIFFAQQEVEQIPVEPHDIPLPHVVTENGWRKLL